MNIELDMVLVHDSDEDLYYPAVECDFLPALKGLGLVLQGKVCGDAFVFLDFGSPSEVTASRTAEQLAPIVQKSMEMVIKKAKEAHDES